MKSTGSNKSRFGRGLVAVSAALLVLVLLVIAVGLLLPAPGEQLTPMGLKRNTSVYLPMRDGTDIAVDLWLPPGLESGQRIPTLLYFTRYGRASEPGLLKRVALGLGLEGVHPVLQAMSQAGNAVVMVDARGSGASGGTRSAELSPDEVADESEVADWAISQPWSNGRVGAMGVSYVGTASELLAATGNPAVRAVAPLFSDFDGYTGLVRPGGVLATEFVRAWGTANQYMDSNDSCHGAGGLACAASRLWVKGVKPVDADPEGERLQALLAGRRNYDIQSALALAEFVDDPVGSGPMGQTFPVGNLPAIERSGVPMQVWVSWLDAATVDGALARYNTISNPQELIIAPFNHGGSKNADPYQPAGTAPEPGQREQYAQRLAFMDQYLKHDNVSVAPSVIRYFTMGEGRWKTTDVWPPRGFHRSRWYFSDGHQLSQSPPHAGTAFDTYRVDYSATTGLTNRWLANLSGSNEIRYPDRAQQDRKLLVYDSPPLTEALEITGAPAVTLYLESSEPDVALFVYLEDVAPDGSVTYVTEGILRAIHHKLSDADPPVVQQGPYRSFNRADAMPLEPGEVTEIKMGLINTSVRIAAGHQLRIAIAGHDAAVFQRTPETGDPVLNVYRGLDFPSHVDFPAKVSKQ